MRGNRPAQFVVEFVLVQPIDPGLVPGESAEADQERRGVALDGQLSGQDVFVGGGQRDGRQELVGFGPGCPSRPSGRGDALAAITAATGRVAARRADRPSSNRPGPAARWRSAVPGLISVIVGRISSRGARGQILGLCGVSSRSCPRLGHQPPSGSRSRPMSDALRIPTSRPGPTTTPSSRPQPPSPGRPTPRRRPGPRTRRQPPYNVVILNDEEHTFEYVIELLGKLFAHPVQMASVEPDLADPQLSGRAIVVYDHAQGEGRVEARSGARLRPRSRGWTPSPKARSAATSSRRPLIEGGAPQFSPPAGVCIARSLNRSAGRGP